MVNRVNRVHESDKSRFPLLVALVTSMYRSGNGNDASLGTYNFDYRSNVMTVNAVP